MIIKGSEIDQSTRVGSPMGTASDKHIRRVSSSGYDGERSFQSTVTPAPRLDRPGHGSCKRRRGPAYTTTAPRRHEDAPERARSHGSGGHACDVPSPFEQEEQRWVMPWERQPSWMYLPHLLDSDGAGKQDKGEEQSPEGGRSDNSGGGNDGMDHDRRIHIAAAAWRGDEDGDASAGHAIRGQRAVPGPVNAGRRRDEVGGAAQEATRIRGPLTEPGARGSGGAAATAQQRLDARNAHLSISLAQHADRVRKRRLECPNAGAGPTPGERVAALRRRIEERRMRGGQAHNMAADVGGGSCSATGIDEQSRAEAATWSNEDPYKIHQCMDLEANVIGIRNDTAGDGGRGRRDSGAGSRDEALDSAACGDGRSTRVDDAAVGAETAAEWAAGHVAWHTNAQGNGAG